MITVYAKMVADLFHPGHVAFLKKARDLGDRLVVHVVSDERVQKAKRKPIMTQQERMTVLAACRYVDEVRIDGPREVSDAFLDEQGFDLFAYGYSDERERNTKAFEYRNISSERIRIIPYSSEVSTTQLIQRVKTLLSSE
ncbi:MAG: adenylyltransferase/cytidyltransferase family protein [Lunatimonas sp.]|uniref:adenylyltransferase/cytidyltransferase family protein n=1 Tax=Lunatimonas sp. TaxID=2060141 RepID=UPI00263B4CE2|nr:adenylyltransferase/cytidyltransferase family protein [Lunatimonas sp.]MCC5936525.1 adenylyltransferase/cytidyltransferase family protein [Lunatimonas sp.]